MWPISSQTATISMPLGEECPEEVTEVASTLIFAASRYPDLPELCDLRQIFTAKYGTNMESYANTEFVERVQQKSFSKEKKLQVIQDIAREFSVKFDLKALERKLSNPPGPEVERPKKHTSLPAGDEVVSQPTPVVFVHKQEVHVEARDIHVMCDVSSGDSYDHVEKTRKVKDTEQEDVVLNNRMLRYNYKEIQKDDQVKGDSAYSRRPKVQEGLVQEYAAMKYPEGKIRKMVPPYTKNGGTKNGNFMEKNSDGLASEKAEFIHCGLEKKQGAGSLNGKSINAVPLYAKLKVSKDGNNADKETYDDLSYDRTSLAESEHSIHERRPVKPLNRGRGVNLVPPYVKPNTNNLLAHDDRSDCVKHKDSMNGDERTTPMSVRRNFARPRFVQTNEGAVDDEKIVSRTPGGQRRLKSRGAGDDYDEKHMDSYRQPVGDEKDNAINYGRLLHQTASGQRKHTSQRRDANYDGDNYGDKVVDEHPNAVDGEIDNAIDYGKLLHQAPSARRRHTSGRTTCDEGYDEEEGMMDKLLYHYSKKGSVNNELSKAKTRMKTLPADPAVIDRGRVDSKADSQMRDSAAHAPERAVSLPAELLSPAEATRVPDRSTSMQPDLFGPNGGHVHPRMPDYDELAARISVLRMA
ncbi:uncharacterized protein LOC109706143 isoform X2 [Ananas comosus]|uniref:Uncharacterized protein LOC109706143 isoform X2 n=1 Tax=Ananas comosus TaxID=4615 RepID=A0A6P5EMF2_ANACO|nr:uncharacterized protein LOC109706143 isoform X2 [Ananas comosus]